MLKAVLAVCCLAAVSLIAEAADAAFKPRLDQVSVNGELLYKEGELLEQPRKLDVTLPAKVEYVFTNVGEKGAEKPLAVFVHFTSGGKIVAGGDFTLRPRPPNGRRASRCALSAESIWKSRRARRSPSSSGCMTPRGREPVSGWKIRGSAKISGCRSARFW
ncbi:MAG: hypothetical protein L6W00_07680 [Lentisphaeria bacterium]|nr:MAG: hypothetical protein L6W00_07680 [Lentisphaeria bacterium]